MSYLPPDLRPTLLLRRTAAFLDGLKRREEIEHLAPPLEAAHASLQTEHDERERHMTTRDEARNASNLGEMDLHQALRFLWRLAVRKLVGSDQRLLFPHGFAAETRRAGASLIEGCEAVLRRLDALHESLQERLAPARARLEHALSTFPGLLEAREQASAALGTAFQRERRAATALHSAAHRAREEVRRIDPALLRAICPRNSRRRDADPDDVAA